MPDIHRLKVYGQVREEWLSVHGRLFDNVEKVTDAPFVPPMCPSVETATWYLQNWAHVASQRIDSWGPRSVYGEDFDEAIRFVSVGGLPTRRDDQAPNQVTPEELQRDDLPPGPGLFHRMSKVLPGPAFRAQCGRRAFLTGTGFLGIGPAEIRPDDSICLLDGGQTPYAIRQTEDDMWKFIGECYIHGIMFGQTLDWPDEKRHPETDFTFV